MVDKNILLTPANISREPTISQDMIFNV